MHAVKQTSLSRRSLSDKIDQIAVWQELKGSQQASPIHIFCRHQGHQKV
jgi:hypothetical protein